MLLVQAMGLRLVQHIVFLRFDFAGFSSLREYLQHSVWKCLLAFRKRLFHFWCEKQHFLSCANRRWCCCSYLFAVLPEKYCALLSVLMFADC